MITVVLSSEEVNKKFYHRIEPAPKTFIKFLYRGLRSDRAFQVHDQILLLFWELPSSKYSRCIVDVLKILLKIASVNNLTNETIDWPAGIRAMPP